MFPFSPFDKETVGVAHSLPLGALYGILFLLMVRFSLAGPLEKLRGRSSNLPRYSNSKVIPRIIRIRGTKFFCHARAISKAVPVWL
jgi:hypothetical protein